MPALAEDTLPPDVVAALLGRRNPVHIGVVGWAAVSRRGTARAANEDAHGARGGRVFVVADGMGGRPGGAVAAAATVAALLDGLDAPSPGIDWSQLVERTNREVIGRGREAGHERVGAAVVAARVADGRVTILHLGDARAYRVRPDGATQLTSDHNLGTEVDRARLDPRRLGLVPASLGALTVFLGDPGSSDGFGVRSVTVAAGDRLVLCTDGVHGTLTPEAWRRAAELDDDAEAATALVEIAIDAGSTDDATALVITFGVAGTGVDARRRSAGAVGDGLGDPSGGTGR